MQSESLHNGYDVRASAQHRDYNNNNPPQTNIQTTALDVHLATSTCCFLPFNNQGRLEPSQEPSGTSHVPRGGLLDVALSS